MYQYTRSIMKCIKKNVNKDTSKVSKKLNIIKISFVKYMYMIKPVTRDKVSKKICHLKNLSIAGVAYNNKMTI